MSIISLESGVVRVAPYAPDWKRLFNEEKTRLHGAIGDYALDIQHIGGTSIPGMMAKPIIDIAVAIPNFEEGSRCVEPIVRLGYEYRGEYGMPRRHYFVKGDPRAHHLHMVELTSVDWKEHLLFRDYLISHSNVAEEYAVLKEKAAEEFRVDRQAYQAAKSAFIRRVLESAQ